MFRGFSLGQILSVSVSVCYELIGKTALGDTLRNKVKKEIKIT